VKKTAITVTEASRNFADCVNRVRYQNATFVLHKNGEPVAQLTPMAKKKCTGRDLADALSKVQISDEELRDWRRDVAAGREMLLEPTDKWE
jgi:prevent-host-death family protein